MAKQRSTFGKIQREQEKRAKQQAKREKRAQKGTEEEGGVVEETQVAADQGAILDALARLYQQYENGELETDDFELRRDELRAQIDLG
jgi:hypothetical protein